MGTKEHKTLVIKPSDESQSYINTIGGLLNKTLPQNWEKARIYAEKNNNITEWKGHFFCTDTKEIPFVIDENFIINLEKLRNEEKYICPISSITFYKNGVYEINYENISPEQLPLNKIQEIIKKLKSIDLKDADINIIKKQISTITVTHKKKTPKLYAGQKFFRGVKWPAKTLNVNQLSYPPVNLVNTFHRCGRVNHPLFYCSNAMEAVFYELNCSKGDTISLSEWESTQELLVNHVGYHKPTLEQLKSKRSIPWWGVDGNEPDMKESDLTINKFLAEEFTKTVPIAKEYLYKTSVAIAEQHFQQEMFDGLMYPAIAMKGNADNFALKPHTVDNKLILEKVEYIEITGGDKNSGYEIKRLDFANSFAKDGKIEWKGRLPHWIIRKRGETLKVAVENGKWIARNPNGEIVEPE